MFSWDILWELVRTNFKLKYKGSILGFLWVLLKPFFVFLILFAIFVNIVKGTTKMTANEFALYLLIGMVFFNFFNEGIIFGMNSLLDKSQIILKVNFNRLIAVASSIALAMINFGVNLVIVGVVGALVGVHITLESGLYLVGIIFGMIILIFAISLFTSIILIRLRDLTHITELVLQLLFYASAVFIPIEAIPERFHELILLNPIAVFIQAARSAVMYGIVDRPFFVAISILAASILFITGFLFFEKRVKKITEYF
jgi:ABC-2 type transport system permease protein